MDKESTLKLYHHLFSYISQVEVVAVYVDDKEYKEVFSTSKFIRLVSKVEEADFIMVTSDKVLSLVTKSKLDEKTILFATKYRYLKESNKVIGAFYWKKSRFQYLFLKKRLDSQNISLPPAYRKYILDDL